MNGMQLKELAYNGIYRAKVEDNLDPSQYGRIKARAYPMFADIDSVVQLPWAVPAMGLFTGAALDGSYTGSSGYSGTSYGSFCVPDIGSFVFVFFENGDPYQPVYFAEAQTAGYGLPSEKGEAYPKGKVAKTKEGWLLHNTPDKLLAKSPSGHKIQVEETANRIIVEHKNGSIIEIDGIKIDLKHAVPSNGVTITAAGVVAKSLPSVVTITPLSVSILSAVSATVTAPMVNVVSALAKVIGISKVDILSAGMTSINGSGGGGGGGAGSSAGDFDDALPANAGIEIADSSDGAYV
jgi:hypothetical protein